MPQNIHSAQCTLTSKKRAFYKIISCQSLALLLRERKGVGPIKGGMGDSIAITNNSLNQRETQISSLSKGQPLKTPSTPQHDELQQRPDLPDQAPCRPRLKLNLGLW